MTDKTITKAAYVNNDNTTIKLTFSDGSTTTIRADADGTPEHRLLEAWKNRGNEVSPPIAEGGGEGEGGAQPKG
jgi:hypothetical protein